MIVKLQRPLSDPSGPLLIYSQRREFNRMVDQHDVPAAVRTALVQNPKLYFEAVPAENAAGLVFGRQVGQQNW